MTLTRSIWTKKTPVTVEKAQVHKNVVLMHIKGIDTVEAAEAMRNKVLHLDREDVELPEDLVFIQDILASRCSICALTV